MAFLSSTDQREVRQGILPAERKVEPTFGDVFGASVGLIFDEELSISKSLNREGEEQRKLAVRELSDSEQIPISRFTNAFGDVDYDGISEAFPDSGIKTDRQLHDERTEVLRKRRAYAKDIQERGSGMAQFLGSMSAFMLDPINVAAFPFGASVSAGRGLTVMGNAMRVAKAEAGIAVVSESLIQPLVFEHKEDINSPYSALDAITNIALASVGASVIGGTGGGISQYLRRMRGAASEVPVAARSPDFDDAMGYTRRLENTLEENRIAAKSNQETRERLLRDYGIDLGDETKKFVELDKRTLQEIKSELLAETSGKISRVERKNLTSELKQLRRQIDEAKPERVGKLDVPEGVPARQAKREAVERAARAVQDRVVDLNSRASRIEQVLEADAKGRSAEGELSRLEQGKVSDAIQSRINRARAEADTAIDADFLRALEAQRQVTNQPTIKPGQYDGPEPIKAPAAKSTPTERKVMDRDWEQNNFDQQAQEFGEIKNPVVADENGNLLNARELVDDIDEELAGIEDILRCVRG